MSPGLFFDKVKFSFACRKLHFFHPYRVKFKQWTNGKYYICIEKVTQFVRCI